MTEQTERTSPAGMTAEDFIDTLTGFDEIAIARSFDGLNVYTQGEAEPIMVLRALTFVDLRRGGKSDSEARAAVLNMPLGDVTAYFEDDDDDPDPESTPAGKDDSPGE